MNRALPIIAVLVAIVAAASVAAAPASRPARPPQNVAMELTPAALPRPALSITFLPEVADQVPGNAATLYLLAIASLNQAAAGDQDPVGDCLAAPLAKLPRDQATRLIDCNRAALRQVELAARRERCHWDLPVRSEGVATLLPHLGHMRSLARLLALQARLDIARGDYPAAVRSIQTGLTMAHHLSQQALLIQGLVAAAIAELFLNQVQELSQAPGAPNLYWALAHLPRPFIDLHASMQWERSWIYLSLPRLRDVRTRSLSSEEWRQALAGMVQMIGSLEGNRASWQAPLVAAAAGVALYPRARGFLLGHGFTDRQLDAMQAPEVVGRYCLLEFEETWDESYRWYALPYWQARPRLIQAEHALRDKARAGLGNPLVSLLPALNGAMDRTARLDQRIAALQAMQILRAHAAAHSGRLPQALDHDPSLPAPINPITGQPFTCDFRQGQATLEATFPPWPDANTPAGTIFTITIKP